MKARSRLNRHKHFVPYTDKQVKLSLFIGFALLMTFILTVLAVIHFNQDQEELLSPIPNGASLHVVSVAHASEIEQSVATPEPVKTAKVTAYSCGGLKTEAEIRMNCPSLFSGEPTTADGSVPQPYKTVACDRANLGKYFEIESVGRVKCTDTGGAIKGAGRFDLYVTDVQEARQWGVKQLEYKVIE